MMIPLIAAMITTGILAFMTIKIVSEYQRLVILRFGKVLDDPKGPGLVLVIPFVDRPILVDLRENMFQVPQLTCITRDNASIAIDFLIYSRVVEPKSSILAVQDFQAAAQGIATTTLRAVIGDIPLDDVFAKREQINIMLQEKMDMVTARWGVKISTVEISDITPPKEIEEAMTRQMSAERSRRATVTEAEGTKEAAILVADGEKQSAILKAEGRRQSSILEAEGEALALETIHGVAKHVEFNTMTLQYLQTLKNMSTNPATTFVFPMEFQSLLTGIVKANQQSLGKS
ncbi:MAG: SPFH/Band 7/PHB domain protein [Nitrospirales bacterium]|nr:SPFH/Band 7/PHB domain protein [Nitrospirales bacterium]